MERKRRKIREKFPSPRNFEEGGFFEGRIRGRGREDRVRSSIPRGGVGDSSRKLWRAAGIRVEHTLRTSFIFDSSLHVCLLLPSFLPFHFPDLYLYTCLYSTESDDIDDSRETGYTRIIRYRFIFQDCTHISLTFDKRLSAQFLLRSFVFSTFPSRRGDAFLSFLPHISKTPDCIRIFFSFSTSSSACRPPPLSLSLSFVIPIGTYIYIRLEPSHRRFMNSVVKAPLSEHGGAVAPFVSYAQFVSFSQFAPFTLLLCTRSSKRETFHRVVVRYTSLFVVSPTN